MIQTIKTITEAGKLIFYLRSDLANKLNCSINDIQYVGKRAGKQLFRRAGNEITATHAMLYSIKLTNEQKQQILLSND